jgi:hypothetical protein
MPKKYKKLKITVIKIHSDFILMLKKKNNYFKMHRHDHEKV